ncbi:glutathione synthetase-like isoform X2 [Coccinella septempunctata]|uniref:glutathione synthetase-like isoform X2 n=1 Tax=Coccinella septempunctata TaxID=41139 RepID=UPI001D07412D|nr:glutathione synthetase-like isoform X2 [Coccinella septempunctata]
MSLDPVYLPNPIPVPIPDEQLKEIVNKSRDWAIMHGAAMRNKKNFSKDSVQIAPYILIPSCFPRKEFNKAIALQPILNELMHRVAHDQLFLTECLRETIQVDEFTGNLFKIFETVQNEGITQRISLGLLRSDYMVNTKTSNSIKQVEINTIASSLAGLSIRRSSSSRFVLHQLGYGDQNVNLPENNALEGLCGGLIEAWKIYGNENAAILFVVEEVTINICDQRFHEFEIYKLSPQTKVVRKTLVEIAKIARLGPNNELMIGDVHIAVVYFRSGYEPEAYPTKKEWDARLLIERSQAIKCPSIQYHLAGTKKVQQALARSGALDMFLTEAKKIEAIKEIFTGLYSLDFDEFGDQAVQMALDEPERFVLKPQREGGGNNIYGADVRKAMLEMKNSKERTAWILMERIHPPISKSYIVRPGDGDLPDLVDVISELGIYGVVIGDSQKILVNRQVGHMLRTKLSSSDEGGVAAGSGALDSPLLIDLE